MPRKRPDYPDEVVVLENVRCEKCGDLMKYFIGYKSLIVCSRCAKPIWQMHFCGNTTQIESSMDIWREAQWDNIVKIYEGE